MKRLPGALLAVATLAFTHQALASEAPSAEASPPRKEQSFMLSLGVGPGLFSANSSSSPNHRHFSGESLSFSLLVGGRLNRTFSFGGAYLRDEIFGLRAKDSVPDNEPLDLSQLHFFTSSFGVFGDFALPSRPELHLQALVGYGSLFVDGRPPILGGYDNPSGFIYSGTLSAEFRVARAFTLGAALRVLYADFSVTETLNGSTPVNVLIPALMLTGRYE